MKRNAHLLSSFFYFLLFVIFISSCTKQSSDIQFQKERVNNVVEAKGSFVLRPSAENDSLLRLDRIAHPEVYRYIDSALEAEQNYYLIMKRGTPVERKAVSSIMSTVHAYSNSAVFPAPTAPASLKYEFQWDELDFAGPMTVTPFVTAVLTPKSVTLHTPYDIRIPSNGVRAYIINVTVVWYYVGGSGSTFTHNYKTFGNIFEDLTLSQPTLTIQLL